MVAPLQDLRSSARSLLKTPGFSAAAVLVLALGLGANAALFSAMNALFVRPLPFPEADRLVTVFENLGRRPVRLLVSVPTWQDLRKETAVFSQVAALARGDGSLDTGDLAEPVRIARTTSSFFPLLGVQPQLGRVFTEAEERLDAAPVALLSHELWWRRYGGDPALIGRPVAIDGVAHTVVGILPPGFLPQLPAEVWAPAVFTPEQLQPDRKQYGLLLALARLQDGVTPEAAQEAMTQLTRRLREENPEARSLMVVTLRDLFHGDLRVALLALLAAVGVLLLIACANVANLLLVRASAQQKEIAIRLALGAPRGRLIVQLLLEGVLLAAAGAGAGLLIAMWSIELLVPSGSEAIRAATIEVDGRVLVATLLAALLTGLVAALLPALQATRPSLTEMLKQGRRRAATTGRRGVRNALVIVEVALALVLLFGAGHALGAFRALLRTDPGFDARDVVTLRLSLPPGTYPSGRVQARFLQTLLRRTAQLPGVAESGFLSTLPLKGTSLWHFDVEGPQGKGSGHVVEHFQIAGPGTFRALRIPVVAGRGLADEDGPEAPRVAVINQAMARRYWPGEDAVGKRVRPYRFHFEDAFGKRFWPHDGKEPEWFTIVGVVGDVRQVKLQVDPRPEVYLPAGQFAVPEGTLVLRQNASVDGLAPAQRQLAQQQLVAQVKGAVADLDPNLALYDVAPLEQIVRASASQERDVVTLLILLAALALLLAGIGIYGVMASVVTERTREIGIRLALGAHARSLVRLLLWQGVLLALVGVVLGWFGAALVATPISVLVSRPRPFDPLLCLWSSLALMAVALAASWLPTRKAIDIDPGIAFKPE